MTEQTEEQPQKTKKRLRMLDEDADGVRTQQLQDDFYVPNRAQ